MPEQKTFMQMLDEWTYETVIAPLYQAWAEYNEAKERGEPTAEDDQRLTEAEAEIQKAIREKTWESYRNGQAAGQPKPQVQEGERKPYRRPFRPHKSA